MRWIFVFSLLSAWASTALAQSHTSFRVAGYGDLFQPSLEECDLLAIDTLLYVENRGLNRILFDLNGHKFKLVTARSEQRRSVNAFLIPLHGEITFHIGDLINQEGDNCIAISVRGTAGADADIIIGDLLVPGQTVAGTINDLRTLPQAFDLGSAFPNPFTDRTTISFSIPERLSDGARLEVHVYDVLGRPVRRLENARYFPGEFHAEWDGTNAHGETVPPGVYIYYLRAIEFEAAGKAVKVR